MSALCIHLNPPLWKGWFKRPIFKLVWIEFSFSLTGCLTKAKNSVCLFTHRWEREVKQIWNELSFYTGYLTKAKESVCPTIYPLKSRKNNSMSSRIFNICQLVFELSFGHIYMHARTQKEGGCTNSKLFASLCLANKLGNSETLSLTSHSSPLKLRLVPILSDCLLAVTMKLGMKLYLHSEYQNFF